MLYWCRYIGDSALDLRSHPGGLMIHLERRRTSTVSRLVVSRARLEDGADYTCSPAGGRNHTVTVHVTGENLGHLGHLSEAQPGAVSQRPTRTAVLVFLLVSLLTQ